MNTAAQILDQVKSIKGTSTDQDVTIEKNRAMIAGGTIGLMMGLYYGFSKKHNMLICGVIGGASGAAITRLAMPK